MKLVLEGGDDPEVAAAASDAPEQVLVLLRAGPQQLSVGGRDVGGYQVVAGESIAAVEPAQPAAEREPCDPGHDTTPSVVANPNACVARSNSPKVSPGSARTVLVSGSTRTAFMPDRSSMMAPSPHRVPRDAVATPAHREREVVSTCELDAADHVGRIHRPDHGERAPIDHAVEHGARRVVATVAWADHLPPQTRPELLTNRTRDPTNIYRHRAAASPLERRAVQAGATLHATPAYAGSLRSATPAEPRRDIAVRRRSRLPFGPCRFQSPDSAP